MSKEKLQEEINEGVRVLLVLSSICELLEDEGIDAQSILDIANTLERARAEIEGGKL